MKKLGHRYFTRTAVAVIAMAAAFAFAAERLPWASAAWLSPPVEAPHKNRVSVDENEEINKGATKANVLFFLDTSHPMMLEPRGRLPYVVLKTETVNWVTSTVIDDTETQKEFGYSKAEAIDMMKYVTFGVGTVPPVDSFQTAKMYKWINYGRDTDERNNLGFGGSATDINDPVNKYKYYSPYGSSGHTLSDTFVNQEGLYGGKDEETNYYNYDFKSAVAGGAALPYMLVFKDPKHWKTGWTGPGAFTSNDLVPNDSRMYQMKLVMWRLLDDRMLFENIRFGMSTVYTDAISAGDQLTTNEPSSSAGRTGITHIVYKIYPWGATDTYKNGTYYITKNGTTESNTGDSASTQGGTWGVYGTTNKPALNHQRRAFLRVPIADYNKEWTTKGGNVTMTQLERFRQWMDGIEDVAGQLYTGDNSETLAHHLNADQFDVHKNPELKVSSPVHISRTIFPNSKGSSDSNTDNPNRQWYLSQKGVAYAKKDKIFYNTGMSGVDRYNFYFKPGSGQAVGSVLDFFSPDMDTFNTSAGAKVGASDESEKFSDMIDEQFPIRNACDPNWMILFTAGDNSPAEYPLAEAIGNLYNYTRDNDVTVMYRDDLGNRQFQKARLDKPIRTIVVGFVDPDDKTPASVTMQENLKLAAKAGDPDNENAHAYFANDVPTLLEALREIMVIINNDIQPAKGAMLEGDSFADDNIEGLDPDAEKLNLYAGAYRINLFDQWEGSLTKYVTAKDAKTGAMVTKKGDELGEKLLDYRKSHSNAPRNLLYWAGGQGNNFMPIAFTGASGAGRTQAHPLAEMVGLGSEIVASMDMAAIPEGNFNSKTHLSRAMFDWYHGYDVSYIDGNYYYQRRFMLADQGNSGISKVGPPNKLYSLPGFYEYANDNRNIETRLYTQTNDGVLHVVDPKSMEEEKAILPPPTLLPRRMFSLKSSITDGRYRWIDVKDYMNNTEDDIPLSSNPSYILDGPLQTRYFNMGSDTSPAWSAFLFGTLGRGGGGIYSMEVGDPTNPQFYWYRETIENEGGGLTLFWKARNTTPANASFPGVPNSATIERGGGYWSGVYLNPDAHPYEQLGFNSPRPHFSVAETTNGNQKRNIIALSGGLQNSLDLNENGKMGAALYLIDPNEAYHAERNPSGGARVFNGGSFASVGSDWTVGTNTSGSDPYMGMMVGEPTFLATKATTYVARGMFASDNRGSIFYVSFIDPDTEAPLDWDDWKIRAIASLRKSGDPATASYSIPSGVVGGTRTDRSDEIWIGGGTASVGVKGSDEKLNNNEQMIFCFKMPYLKSATPPHGMTLPQMTSQRSMWTGLSRDVANSGIAEGDEGWYITLEPPGTGHGDEYVTTQPVMFGGNLYAGTFIETTVGLAAGACDVGRLAGKSRLYAVGWETGEAGLWSDKDDKYVEFDGIRFVGFTMSEKGKTKTLIVTYDVLDPVAADSSIGKNVAGQDDLSRVEGMDALSIRLLGSDDPPTPVVSNDSVVNYWLYTK